MGKICSKCEIEFELSEKYFCLRESSKDGFHTWCKKCLSDYKKKYRKDNIEIVTRQHKQYYRENKEECNKYNKEYYLANKNIILEEQKEYYNKNKGHITERNNKYKKANGEFYSRYMKQYAKSNKNKLQKYHEEYCLRNKEAISKNKKEYLRKNYEYFKELRKQYAIDNKEQYNVREQRRRAIKRSLPHALTITQWESTKKYFNKRCVYCGKEEPLAQEHFIPLIKGGEYTHNNIICACQSCNSSKGARDFFTWYPAQEYYSKSREQKILKYLNYKNEIQQLTFAL